MAKEGSPCPPPCNPHCGYQERELYIFDGMKGFEDFDPMDDSSLSAILDDLQEGTLLSLLNDNSIFNDLNEDTSTVPEYNEGSKSKGCEVDLEELLEGLDGQEIAGDPDGFGDLLHNSDTVNTTAQTTFNTSTSDVKGERFEAKPDLIASALCTESLSRDSSSSSISSELSPITLKRSLEHNTDQSCSVKKARLDGGTSESGDLEHVRACVSHDHCYTSDERRGSLTEGQRSPLASSSDSVEEGNNSDAGYETMSASTSPGNASTSDKQSTKQLSPSPHTPSPATLLPPLTHNIDPVALIDARIKHFMNSREVNLTEEEKETLKAEGLPIPTTLPLTKTEEKALRNVRRKIRNKVSAQESRKRKKQHMLTMEEKVKVFCEENTQLKKKVEVLETENKSLMAQIKKLQALMASSTSTATKRTTQVGACLMVVVLCFAVFFGSWSPHRLWGVQQPSDYTTSSVRSRSLLSVDHPTNFKSMACDWFKQIFMREEDEDLDELSYPGPSVACSNGHCTRSSSMFDSVRESHHQTSPVMTNILTQANKNNHTLNHSVSM